MIIKKLNSYSESVSHISMLIVLNMILAVVALVKDVYLASFLGATAVGDAFLLAFFLMDAVGNNLMAGGLMIGCVPYFSSLYVKGRFTALRKGSRNIAILVGLFMLLISAMVYISIDGIVFLVGRGFDSETIEATVELMKLLLPMLLAYPVIAIMVAYAQVHERFKVTAIVPISYNLTILSGIIVADRLGLSGHQSTRIIAVTITVGLVVILSALFVIDEMASRRDEKERVKDFVNHDMSADTLAVSVKKVFDATLPYMVIIILMQGMLYVERGMASRFESGSISGLNYAYRLSQFPIWVIVAAVNTVIYPKIAKKIASDNVKSAMELINITIWNVIVLVLPITGMFFIFREPIISTLFLRDAFDTYALRVTTAIFSTYCMVVIPQSIIFLSVRFHMSLMEKKKAMIFLGIGFLINLTADIMLLKFFGLYTFGIGAFIGSMASAALFIYDFRLSSAYPTKVSDYKLVKLLMVGLVHIGLTFICYDLWNIYFAEYGSVIKLITLGVLLIVESVVYLIIVLRMGILKKSVKKIS